MASGKGESSVSSHQVSLFVAIDDWEQKLVGDSPFLMITGQDRGRFLIQRNHLPILILVLPISEAYLISDLQATAI